jgi:hypothetical protein
LGLIRKNPRDYRGIYARVMDVPELAVSPEDSQAAALMYELADSRRENLDGLSPEKLRELADQNEEDEFAELLRTGKARFESEAEKRYVKRQDKQIAGQDFRLSATMCFQGCYIYFWIYLS